MIRHEMLPNFVLLLENTSGAILPGQVKTPVWESEVDEFTELDECWSEAIFDANLPITAILDNLNIPYACSGSKDINDPKTIQMIHQRSEPVFIYSGFGGALLRKDVLSLGKRFLHVHGGYLPDFKGSTTNYFSLLIENTLGASAIFLSEEIDSGPVLLRRKFPPPRDRQAIDHIYDSGARAKILIETLQKHLKSGKWEFELAENAGGETYYIIHPVLKHIAILEESIHNKV